MMQVDPHYTTDQSSKGIPFSCMITSPFVLRTAVFFEDASRTKSHPGFHGSRKDRQTGKVYSIPKDVSSVAFLPDGKVVGSASDDRVLMLLDAAMGVGAHQIGIHIQEHIHHRKA